MLTHVEGTYVDLSEIVAFYRCETTRRERKTGVVLRGSIEPMLLPESVYEILIFHLGKQGRIAIPFVESEEDESPKSDG